MPAKILIVDDDPLNLDLLQQELVDAGYTVMAARDGAEALQKVQPFQPDVILMDTMMPKLSGLEVVQRLKADQRTCHVPVIMLTARGSQEDKVRGLDAGADDYVVKPFEPFELMARVRSMLRIKELHDRLEGWNRALEGEVRRQVDELQRMSRLKRYLAPQIADMILASDTDTLFRTHRREITAVFLDLRGFTEFSDNAEPEEVLALLNSYHAAMGQLIFQVEGTLERFAGDGIMVFFNDPIVQEDHTDRAVRMALQMRDRVKSLRAEWLKKGYDLDLGIGLAAGYATLGSIGFEARMDYGAVGNVINLAARLSTAAEGGQILTNQRTVSKIEHLVQAEPLSELHLKGFHRPVQAFNIIGLKA